MTSDGLTMNGPAALAFLLLLAGAVAALAGDAVQRVIDCRRRWSLRERELGRLEWFHASRYPREEFVPLIPAG